MKIQVAKPSLFRMDWAGVSEWFEGYTTGRKYNGFACPYFTREQADKVIKALNSRGFLTKYDASQDAYVTEGPGNRTPRLWRATTLELLGVPTKVYGIGAFAWFWSEKKI